MFTAIGFAAEVQPAKTVAAQTKGTTAPATKAESKEPAADASASAEGPKITLDVPLFSPLFDKSPVAVVNDDPILVEDLKSTLEALHKQVIAEGGSYKKDYRKILDRLITTKLILAEASSMGLDEEAEIKTQVDAYALDALRDRLKQKTAMDVTPDPKLVERFYKTAVQEWKLRSLKFDKKEDADAFAKQVASGGDFDKLADKLIAGGKVEGDKEGSFVKPDALLPQISSTVRTMGRGAVSPVIAVGPAFTVFRFEDIRFPAGDAAADKTAREKAITIKRNEVLRAYNETLIKKYMKINTKLLKSLDYEAKKPGFDKLLNDKRVIVTIQGEKPITVGDLALAMSKKFFHGVDQAVKEHQVNVLKQPVLDNLIYRITFVKEAKRLELDKTEDYKKQVKGFKDSLVFGKYVEKVIAPEVKVSDAAVAAYYQEHIKEYTSSAMVKVGALAFKKQPEAEQAADKLRHGTDFDWIKNNAEGQVTDKDKLDELLVFSDNLLTVSSLPQTVQQAVEHAKTGDVKLAGTPEGYYYLLQVKTVVPAAAMPLASERKGIYNKLFAEEINNQLEGWADKLKTAYKVKVFLVEGSNKI